MAVVLVLLTVVFGSLVSMLSHSHVFSAEFTREGVVEETGWRILARLGDELFKIDPDSLLPIVIDNNNYIEFLEVLGINSISGNPILSDYVVIGWHVVKTELMNGQDDNGDGRIDEGYISRLERNKTNPGGNYPGPGQWKTEDQRTLTPLAGNIVVLRFNSTVGGLSFSVDVGLVDDEGVVTQETFTRQISFR